MIIIAIKSFYTEIMHYTLKYHYFKVLFILNIDIIVTSPSIVEALFDKYSNINKSFSLYLNSDPKDKTFPSFISFGSYDLSIVGPNAKFFYTPVIRSGSHLRKRLLD